MLNITPICKAFGKYPYHFSDNKNVKGRCKTVKGRYNSCTEIPDDLIVDFLLWLPSEVKDVLVTKGVDAALEYARSK